MPTKPKTDPAVRQRVIGTVERREFRFETKAVDTEARTAELAWSSEEPYGRWFGMEILDHAPGSVRMDRMTDGAPLLLQHDPDRQIGVIQSARIDKDKVGRAVVRFSRSPLGDEIMQDVADGIRTKVSVGYMVHEMRLEETADDGDTYRVTDWEPIEASIVSIPADNSVGVGRDHNPGVKAMPDPTKTPGDPAPEPKAKVADPAPTRAADPAPEPKTIAVTNPEAEQIREVGRHFKMTDAAEDHIMLGGTLADFRQKVREEVAKRQPEPVPTEHRFEARIPHTGNLRAFRANLYDGGRKEAEEQAYRAGQWCKAVIFGDEQAARWCRDHGMQVVRATNAEQRVLTGVGAGQSVVVPDEMVLPMINLQEQYGMARRMCYVHPMSSDTATVPRRASGVTAYFVGREGAPTANDPGMDNINLTAKNVATETRLSNDYADDSAINLADFVVNEHAIAFATKEDECLINGDGSSTYGGIVGLRTLLLDSTLAGGVDGASGIDTLAEITATDLRNVMAALPDFPGINPVWICSKYAQNTVFGRLTDAAGGNTKRDVAAKMPDQYAGYDIATSPTMPKVATDLSNVVMVLFGDLRMGVVFGDRRRFTLMVDPYSLSSNQQTKLISSQRFDINCHGIGDTSLAGPIVSLIGE